MQSWKAKTSFVISPDNKNRRNNGPKTCRLSKNSCHRQKESREQWESGQKFLRIERSNFPGDIKLAGRREKVADIRLADPSCLTKSCATQNQSTDSSFIILVSENGCRLRTYVATRVEITVSQSARNFHGNVQNRRYRVIFEGPLGIFTITNPVIYSDR